LIDQNQVIGKQRNKLQLERCGRTVGIRQILGCKLGLERDAPNRVVPWFSLVAPAKFWDSVLK